MTPVRCPSCGRAYGSRHFPFGRTIHCTCGERVGPQQRIGPKPSGEEPRFIADAMLGRVARWLRTLGYDTAYDSAISDADLVQRSLLEERILLTRDRKIPEEWRIDNSLVLNARETRDQLAEIVTSLGLPRPDRLFTRCRQCNAQLEPVPGHEVPHRIPPGVVERTDSFVRCPTCKRVYWQGSHTERMRRLVDEVFGTPPP